MASIKLYGIPNCNTVKKSMDWLKENAINFDFHNFKKEGVSPEMLSKWFDYFGWEKVINKKGLTFKKLSKDEQAQMNSADAAIEYLLNNSSAIKRPVLELDGKPLLLGFDTAEYEQQLR